MSKLNLITIGSMIIASIGGSLFADRPASAQVLTHHEHGEKPDRPTWAKDYATEPQSLEVFIAPCYDPKSEIILQLTPENGGVRVDSFRQVQTQ
jgi:hypothetical protein